MAVFRFRRRAESDLDAIGDFTLRTWGAAQASRYFSALKICCQTLADNPSLGRLCEHIRPGLHRFEHGVHVVFYRRHLNGILISRVLHRSMLPVKHFPRDQDER
jgi:toxin ParE1/3/4